MDKLAVAAALAIKEEPRGTVITLPGSVLFQSAKWDLFREPKESSTRSPMPSRTNPITR